MRLIDADVFVEDLDTEALNLAMDGLKGTPRPRQHLYEIIDRINEQPTAYDIDKVVDELEEMKMRYFLTIANTGDEKLDCAYEQVGDALDKAIEIVKAGGTSDR